MYGKVIQKIRKSKGMNVRQFGELVGLSFSYVAMLEKENSYKGKEKLFPSIETLKQICDATGYSFQVFLEESGYLEPLTVLQRKCAQLTNEQQDEVLRQIEELTEQ